MGPHDDVDLSFLDGGDGRALLGRCPEAGQHCHPHSKGVHALLECLVVLKCEDRGWHENGNLASLRDRHKGGPHRHFGLAEADVPADETVHWLWRHEVLEHRGDGVPLVWGLIEGEAGAELTVEAVRLTVGMGLGDLAFGVKVQQFSRDPLHILRHLLATLAPGLSAEFVETRTRSSSRHISGQKAELVDWEVEAVVIAVDHQQVVVVRPARAAQAPTRAGHVARVIGPSTSLRCELHPAGVEAKFCQPLVATDAVDRMHHQVSPGELGQRPDGLVSSRSPTALRPGL